MRFGDFLLRVRECKLYKRATGMGEYLPQDGGFTVGEQFSTELLNQTYAASSIAGRCFRVPSNANSGKFILPSVDEVSRVGNSRYGGIAAQWLAESQQITASKFRFGRKAGDLCKLGAAIYVSDELLEDSSILDSYVRKAVAEEFGWRLDDAVLDGTGAASPLGILKAAGTITVDAEGGQAANTINVTNIQKMIARLDARSQRDAAWFTNVNCLPQIYAITGYNPESNSLYGKPIIPIEQAKTLGTRGDIVLGDFSQYVLIDKPLKTVLSVDVGFLSGESVYRFTFRINGAPIWGSAITPANGSATVSPYITLATRA